MGRPVNCTTEYPADKAIKTQLKLRVLTSVVLPVEMLYLKGYKRLSVKAFSVLTCMSYNNTSTDCYLLLCHKDISVRISTFIRQL